jgi:hypothetical protein
MIGKFDEYNLGREMALDFFKNMDTAINESVNKEEYKKIQTEEIDKFKSGVKGDIKLNFNLIGTFGAGIGALYPIVDSLISKTAPAMDTRTVVLLTIAAVYLIVLEEKKHSKSNEDGHRKQMLAEVKVILSELQLAGFPNANTGSKNGSDSSVLSKVVECLKATKKIFFILIKGIKKIGLMDTLEFFMRGNAALRTGFIDMISYTAMLVPVMNGINAIIGIYNMDLETFLINLAMFSAGITALMVKHGIGFFMNKLKDVLKISNKDRERLKREVEDIEVPLIKKVGDIDGDGHDLIKEQ